ncbi:MAG TPA: polyketide synthase, partial [Flavitalea sp.]|nr:polyketide synthase [Flavitalea sp.]
MYSKTDIAVIGIGCQFPGAKDYKEYWNNLVAGINSIKEITADRWDISSYYSLDGSRPNTISSKWCGMLENADLFDNRFFNISPKEANVMDPQQRLLLEEAYHCIEDSGVSIKQLQQKITSVHVGISAADYGHYTLTDTETDPYAGLGIYKSIAANRLSHAFGLKGISTAVDAACASGLVAISEAYRLLANGESDFALAGAVSLSLHPGRYIAFSRSRMLSPDGQCKTFDKDANGFVPGEGVGVVLLQRAEDAIKEGKHIYAILKGIAVNHGGKTVTITAPRIEAQREVYLNAYAKANITPDTIGYIEAHGTGTSLGDPIEVESLTQAFRRFTDKKQYCKIGSVKTNIGHLEPTAGMAGFIKLVLMLKHKQIPRTLNIRSLNPIIHFEQTPFIPAFETSAWERLDQGMPLRAGVSAFGFGGVNAHALLEEFPES